MRSDGLQAAGFGLQVVLALAFAGCCGPELKLEDMRSKNLSTPWNAVDYFRTAVRYGDWEAVYETLSPGSQAWIEQNVGRFAFETFAANYKYGRLDKDAAPEVANLSLAELLHRSEILKLEELVHDRTWRVQLYYDPIPPDKTDFVLVNAPRQGSRARRWTVELFKP
jgi:hypothetical protein